MTFYYGRLIIVLIGSIFTCCIAVSRAHGWHQRLMLFCMLLGLLAYSGVGSAMEGVATEFVFFYFVFAIAIAVGFHLSRHIFLPMSRSIGSRVPRALPDIDCRAQWRRVIIAYTILSAFPLVWPEFRVQQLLKPSRPDILMGFFVHFDETPDVLTKLFGYAKLLLGPFFFVALYRFRSRLGRVFCIFAILSYIQYVVSFNYIGRSQVMMYLLILFLAAWMLYPEKRSRLTIVAVSFIPIFLVASYAYSVIRMGRFLGNFGFSDAMDAVLGVEFGLVRDVGMVIYEKGSRIDTAGFIRWLVTLPIPKVLTGPIPVVRINYDISEIVLGVRTGASGWYVVLPGLVAESIYIYGKYLFWIHGVFLGGFAAFFVRLMERVPQFLFLFLYVVVLFGYNVNRAGITGLLPVVTNEFLLFYLYLFAMVYQSSSTHRVSKMEREIPQ